MHARVVFYKFKPGSADAAAKKAEQGLLPIFRKQPGFASYQVIRLAADSVLSVSTWDSEPHAQKAVEVAKTWVTQTLGSDVLSADTHVGTVVFSGGK